MPDFSCAVNPISTSGNCQDQGGLLTLFLIEDSNVDWENSTWDDASYSMTAWTLLNTSSWAEVTFERRNGRLDSLYTLDNGFYEVNLQNLLLKGHETQRTISLGQMLSCCGLIGQLHDNNGQARILGKEYISGGWVDPVDRLRISRHLDTHGAFGTADDTSRDEFDLSCNHSKPLPYSTVSLADMRA